MSTIRAREVIGCPMIVMVEMLLTDQPGWLESFLRIAASEGERAAVTLYGADAGSRPAGAKGARVALGESVQTVEGDIGVPITWRVTGYRALPSFFEGTLTLHASSEDTTDLILAGTWPPDPDAANATRDASMAAAQTCLERLLATLRIAVEEAATAGHGTRTP